MDVQCERCKTEYEFDDALVSGRGTTVKCTNCGLQFKVRKPEGGSEAEDDRWLVETKEGAKLVFTTLKELQRAILAKGVGRHDTLTRGKSPPRALGAIAELAPFFDEKKRQASVPPTGTPPPPPFATSPPPRRSSASSPGIDARASNTPPMGSVAPPRVRGTPPPPPTRNGNAPSGRPKVDTLRPPADGAPPPPARLVQSAPIVNVGTAEPTRAPSIAPATTTRRIPDMSSPLPPPTAPVLRKATAYDESPDPMQEAMAGADREPVLVPGIAGRRRVGGWVIAALLVGCVSVGVFLMAKPYFSGAKPVASAPLDPRAQEFLRIGERALDDGDLEASKENLDKASVVAEKDTRVLLDLARLASARADVPWLKQRLGTDAAGVDETKRALAELGAKAKSAAEAAIAAAPDDPAAIRAKIDALRIAGDRDGARTFVSKVIANASQPETAYVLAALDLAEPEPLWQTVVERLRVATQAEGNAGRARAALVYALARAGDVPGAKSELDKLSGLSRPHPLLASLRTFVEKLPVKGRDAGAPPFVASAVAVSSLPKGPSTQAPSDPNALSGDGRSLIFQANTAFAKRDYPRASQLYAAALDRNPRDSEAQGGLGDVAHAQHDLAGAKSSYTKAIAINAHYLPALIGLGDVDWEMGDKASAQKRYKDIVDNFPDGSYPGRVKERSTAVAPPPAEKPLPSFPIPPPDPTTTAAPPALTAAPAPAGSP